MLDIFRRKVGAKIVLGYLASVSLLVIIGVLVAIYLAQIAATVNDLVSYYQAEIELSQAMVSQIALVRFHADRFIRGQDQADLDAYHEALALLTGFLAQAEQKITDSRHAESLQHIKSEVTDYSAIFVQITELLNQRRQIQSQVLDVQERKFEKELEALRVNFSSNDHALFLAYSNVQTAIQVMRLNVWEYLAGGDARYVLLFDKGYQQGQESLSNLKMNLAGPEQILHSVEAQAALSKYAQGFKDIQPDIARQKELVQRLETIESNISQAASNIAIEARQDVEVKQVSTQAFVAQTQLVLLTAILGAIVTGLLLGWRISHGITMPLQQVVQTAQQIAAVDLKTMSSELVSLSEGKLALGLNLTASPLEVKSRDEVGQTAQAFNEIIFSLRLAEQAFQNMTAYLNEMAGAARSVAQGDLEVSVAVRSPQDVLGNAITGMIVNLRAIQGQVQHQLQRLATLRQIDTLILTSFDLEPTLKTLVEQVTCQLGVDAAEVLLFDPTTQRLESVARHGFPSSEAVPPLPVEDSCAGQVILQNRLVSLTNLAETPWAGRQKADFRTYYGLPLRAKGQIKGVLQLFHHAPLQPDDDWLDYFETLAGQAAIAIDNAELVRGLEERVTARTAELEAQAEALRASKQRLARRAREMAALYETALEVNSQPDVPALLQAVVRRAVELLGARMGGLYLVRPDGQALEMVVNHNMPGRDVGAAIGLGEGLSGRVAQTGKLMMVDDYQHWEGRLTRFDANALRRVLSVPLTVAGRVIGVINIVDNVKTGPFDEEEVRLVSLFADQVAIAVENARLHQAEREQRVVAETLWETGVALGSTLDMETILDRLLAQISRVIPNDTAAIMLIEGDYTRIVRQRGYDLFGSPEFVEAFSALRIADMPTFRSMAESGEPLVIPDTRTDPRWTRLRPSEWIYSFAGVPLWARGEVIGFLNVGSATPGLYGPAQAMRLRAFAVQAAGAIENARLHTAVQQELAERKRVEAALRESEERYRALVETSPDAITLTDLNGNLIMVNRRAVEVGQFASAEELIGTSIFDLIAPEDRQRAIENAPKILEAGGVRGIEYTYLRKDGSRYPGELSVSVIVDTEGKPAAVIGVNRDISKRKQAEEALRESEEKYRILFMDSPDSYLIIVDGVFVDCNRATEVMLRGDRTQIIGQPPDLLSPEFQPDGRRSAEAAEEKINKALQTGHNTFEWVHRRLDGSDFFVEVSIAAMNLDGKPALFTTWRDITERKQLESALQDSEQRYREIFEASPDAIYLLEVIEDGQHFRNLDVNPAFEKMTGIERVDLIGKTMEETSSAEVAQTVNAKYRRCVASRTTYQEEVELNLPVGRLTFHSTMVPLQDAEGHIRRIIGITRDITERKRTEEALRCSEENFRKLFRTNPFPLFIARAADGFLIQMNQALLDYMEISPASSPSMLTVDYYAYPADRQTILNEIETKGRVANRVLELKTGRGGSKFALVNILPLEFSGEACLLTGLADITERKQMEEALRESEAKFYSAFHSSPSALSVSKLQDRVYLDVNDSFLQATGYTREEVLGSTSANLNLWVVPEEMKQYRQLLQEQGSLHNFEYKFQRKNGEIGQALASATILNFGGETCILTQSNDITERKQMEEALLQAKIVAEERSQAAEAANQAKSIFLTNMSHELRTPLNAILGFSALMARDASLSAEQQENLALINHSGEHLLNLINNVLDMAKIESGRMVLQEQVFDLHHLLDHLADMFRLRAINKGLTLIVDCTPDVPRYVYADESKLRQVLINLLSNTLKFTSEGGVGLRVRCMESDKPGFCQLRFEVQDTGPGIAPEDLETIFEPFVQSTSGYKSKEGSGLGLFISRQFARLMGGELVAESSGGPGQGALFKLDIPIELVMGVDLPSLEQQERPRAIGLEPGQRAADGGLVPGGPYRLLVVEDRDESRTLLVKLLTQFGFEVRAAANGLEGVNVWREWQPHLIWMDMRMPVMDGYEATRRIKATSQGQATVIIALTATAFEDQRELILSEGCNDFVRKPFRENDIVEALVKHLGVQFIYESGPAAPRPGAPPQGALDLAGLPAGWLADLKQATIEANANRVVALTELIREQKPTLAAALVDRINNFDLDAILGAISILEPQEAKDE